MPAHRYSRMFVLFACCIALLIIGRNVYRRHINNALFAAVQRDDLAGVQRALDQGADPDYPVDPSGPGSNLPKQAIVSWAMSSLSIVSTARNIEPIVCVLIRKSAAMRSRQESSWALQSACLFGRVNLLRCLLEVGAVPNSGDSSHQSTVDCAWSYDHDQRQNGLSDAQRREICKQMVRLLRDHGATLTLADAVRLGDITALKAMLAAGTPVNARSGQFQETALDVAVVSDVEAVKLLLAHGADPNDASRPDSSPLLSAIQAHRIDIARALLAHGADPNRPRGPYSPPLAAAIYSLPDLAPELLAHGADVNGAEGAALGSAVFHGRVDLMCELLRRGADINAGGGRALTAAIYSGRGELLNELLRRGANPNPVAPHAYEVSPLMMTVEKRPGYFDLLVRAGADPRPDRTRLLLAAVLNGQSALIPRLIAFGADVNAADKKRQSVLILALDHAPSCVKLLLDYGADPNVVTSHQETPLMIAAHSGDTKSVRLLLAHGAKIDACPPHSHTALYWARKKGHSDIVALLQQAGATLDK